MPVSLQIRTKLMCGACLQNEGYYVTSYAETTHLVCGVCTVEAKLDAIKLDDVPKLLVWCREVLAGGAMGGSSFQALREIIGVKP